jgi:hypothetical protein
MSTAAPQRRQRLHDISSNEHLCRARFVLADIGFALGELDGRYGFHMARAICELQQGASAQPSLVRIRS